MPGQACGRKGKVPPSPAYGPLRLLSRLTGTAGMPQHKQAEEDLEKQP